jgi:4-amino-4-deoxy-L-arabinose transferase-like glycosyltransferase
MLIILLLAFFWRTFQLDDQSLRGDEAATVLYSALPVSQLWEHSRVTDPHPPLYYLMLKPWQWLFGEEAWVMRFAGVTASTLAVAALYRLAWITLRSTSISLLGAALLAINPLQIWLAQDIRAYPFFTLLGLLSAWALWQALHLGHNWAYGTQARSASGGTAPAERLTRAAVWSVYVVLTVACLYVHYYTIFLILFQGLFVLLNARKFWSRKWSWLASQLAIIVLISPGLQLAYNFVGQAAGGIDRIATAQLFRLASTALITGFTIADSWGLWLSLLLVPIWLTGLISLLRRDDTSGTFWGLFFAVPVLGVIILSIDRPFFKERFLIQAQPAFEIVLAAGFLAMWSFAREATQPASRLSFYTVRVAATFLFALLLFANFLALGNYFADPAYAKAPPWHLFRNYVDRNAGPDDVMLTNFPEAAVSYYSPNGLPFYVVPVERDRSVAYRLEQTEQIARAYQRIWFLPLLRQGFDEQGEVLNWLDRHADRVNQVFFPDYHLNLYLSPTTIDDNLVEQPATFAHGVHLRGFQILDQSGQSRLTPAAEVSPQLHVTVEPGAELTLSLYWLADGPTEFPFTVFTHLVAADGFNRTNQDNQPVWGTYPTTAWLPDEKVTDKYTLTIPPGTPAGAHQLLVGWYRSDSLERVPVLAETGQPVADHVILNVIILVEQEQN